jgi:large subunit ribosomal protein L47
MARIKYIINERRLAYESAINILAKEREREAASKRVGRKVRRKVRPEVVKKQPEAGTEQEVAAEMAVAGVFETVPDGSLPAKKGRSSKSKVKADDEQSII